MPSCVKVLAGKEDSLDYRGAYVKRTIVATIRCNSADNKNCFCPLHSLLRYIRAPGTRVLRLDGTMHFIKNGNNKFKISLEQLTRILKFTD